jgi:deazaflavin-dependent oxidoreductase (nitroreductase family)
VLIQGVSTNGDYLPSPLARTRDQVELYERSGGLDGTTMRGMPVVVLTMRGARTGKTRKVPLMRVEHDGRYAAVASMGGAPQHPVWYYNLLAHPDLVLQDGPVRIRMRARELTGDERAVWWDRAVAAYPDYAAYQRRTSRTIPVFVLEPADG